MNAHHPSIGIFDSGCGGLTVLKELQKALPHEPMLYLGDTARFPYGTKSRDAIIHYTTQNCFFLADQGVKLIVIACNTATSMALDTVQSLFAIPIIGVIDPVIKEIVHGSLNGRIGILGTRATVLSNVYQTKIKNCLTHAEITAVSAPLLVHLVEEGWIDHPITHLAIREYVEPLLHAQVDTVVLGCTHFPLIRKQIEIAFESHVQVIDPAFACAQAVRNTLAQHHLFLLEQRQHTPRFYVTDDADQFQQLAEQFLESPVTHVGLLNRPLALY